MISFERERDSRDDFGWNKKRGRLLKANYSEELLDSGIKR